LSEEKCKHNKVVVTKYVYSVREVLIGENVKSKISTTFPSDINQKYCFAVGHCSHKHPSSLHQIG
uniref:SVMP n=1 Tax=Brugia timori TaxID=42155 RepID=A0A0R3QHR8_9BILA